MWSIGIVVYMMLTGAPPFKGKDPAEVMEKVLHEIPHFVGKKVFLQ
jgi:serine/threonine protein kinase